MVSKTRGKKAARNKQKEVGELFQNPKKLCNSGHGYVLCASEGSYIYI